MSAEPTVLDAAGVQARVRRRGPQDHKGSFGSVRVFAGNADTPGAALLALQGALRSGAGRVHWQLDAPTLRHAGSWPPEVLLELLRRPPTQDATLTRGETVAADALLDAGAAGAEAHTAWIHRACDAADAILVGPGCGLDAAAQRLLEVVLKRGRRGDAWQRRFGLCLDADALTMLAQQPKLQRALGGRTVLTPHPKEMAHLCQTSVTHVLADPAACAQNFARACGATVLLKGSPTWVAAPDGELVRVGGPGEVGGPALAHGGTGDVLAGLVAGLLAQGLDALDAAAVAAWVHAAAGDVAAAQFGEAGTLASDVARAVGAVWRDLHR